MLCRKMLYESCGCCGGCPGALPATQACSEGVVGTSPVKAIGGAMGKALKHAALGRFPFPSLGACTASSGRPWSAQPWRWEPNSTVGSAERLPKALRNDSLRLLSSAWRHRPPRRKTPQPNYSVSIALQENALRVMCLTRGTPGSAPGEPELLQRRPAHQPW